jgi:predicted negative regulator of RcsB-dependent stress response
MSADLKESSTPLAEISQKPNAFEAFLDRNQKGIAVFAILLVLGTLAFVVYRGIETSRQENAGAALIKAEDAAAFQAVIRDHADTTAAGSAQVLLAESQWAEGKKDEAVATLREFIASQPAHAAIPAAKASLGAKLMAQGKTGDAETIFGELSTDPAARYIAPYALISLGDIAKAAGDIEKAESHYLKVTTDFSSSSFADTASRRLAILKAKPPLEIEAPAAPETTAAEENGDVPAFTLPGMSATTAPQAVVEEVPEEAPQDLPADAPAQDDAVTPDSETAPAPNP